MNFRLKMSMHATEVLRGLQASTGLTPNILARLAVSFSLRIPSVPNSQIGDQTGQEINRATLTGDQDGLYKALIAQHAKRPISDEEYFPDLFRAHLERGVDLIYQEYQLSGNRERFFIQLFYKGME